MRKKTTISRNPLDQLGAPKRKGDKTVPVVAAVNSEIRETILKKPGAAKRPAAPARKRGERKASAVGWLKSAFGRLIG